VHTDEKKKRGGYPTHESVLDEREDGFLFRFGDRDESTERREGTRRKEIIG